MILQDHSESSFYMQCNSSFGFVVFPYFKVSLIWLIFAVFVVVDATTIFIIYNIYLQSVLNQSWDALKTPVWLVVWIHGVLVVHSMNHQQDIDNKAATDSF